MSEKVESRDVHTCPDELTEPLEAPGFQKPFPERPYDEEKGAERFCHESKKTPLPEPPIPVGCFREQQPPVLPQLRQLLTADLSWQELGGTGSKTWLGRHYVLVQFLQSFAPPGQFDRGQ